MPQEKALQVTYYRWMPYFLERSSTFIKRKRTLEINTKNSWFIKDEDIKVAFCVLILDRFNLIKVAKVIWNLLCCSWFY